MHGLEGEVTQWAALLIALGGATEVLRRILKRIRGHIRCVKNGIDHVVEMHEVVVRELMPNTGKSVFDKIYAIDKKADAAVSNAQLAAKLAAGALERIERFEARGNAMATVVVNDTSGGAADTLG